MTSVTFNQFNFALFVAVKANKREKPSKAVGMTKKNNNNNNLLVTFKCCHLKA